MTKKFSNDSDKIYVRNNEVHRKADIESNATVSTLDIDELIKEELRLEMDQPWDRVLYRTRPEKFATSRDFITVVSAIYLNRSLYFISKNKEILNYINENDIKVFKNTDNLFFKSIVSKETRYLYHITNKQVESLLIITDTKTRESILDHLSQLDKVYNLETTVFTMSVHFKDWTFIFEY